MSDARPRRHRGLFRTALVLAVIMVLGGGAYAYWGYRQASGPEGIVRGYFAALGRGDAAGALAYGEVPAGPHTFLTAKVLREQERIAPIRSVHVESVATRGSRAEVMVTYYLAFASGTRQVTDVVPVRRQGSSWRLVRAAIAVTIAPAQAADRTLIAGSAVPKGQTLLFPGALPISFDSPYLRVHEDAPTLGFNAGPTLTPDVDVSAAGRKAIAAAVTGALQACLDAGAKAAPTCPLPSDRVVPGSLRGKLGASVAERMSVTVEHTAAGLIDISGSVPFTGTYRALNYDNVASTRTGTVQLSIASVAYAVAPITVHWTEST